MGGRAGLDTCAGSDWDNAFSHTAPAWTRSPPVFCGGVGGGGFWEKWWVTVKIHAHLLIKYNLREPAAGPGSLPPPPGGREAGTSGVFKVCVCVCNWVEVSESESGIIP